MSNIRIILELLGHSDLKTTMIYTHTVQSVSIKQAKSRRWIFSFDERLFRMPALSEYADIGNIRWRV